MSTIVSIICAVLIFCIIVVVHEFGHYFVARRCGIEVREFAVGMGPVIFKKQGKNTLFTLRIIPLGGYCSMGEDEEATSENSFRNKPVLKRIAVIAAGAVMNLILGFIIGIIIMAVSDKYTTAVVAEILPDSGCEQSGMELYDEITKVNGMTVFTANDIVYALRNDEDGVVDFVVKRGEEKIAIDDVQFSLITDEATGQRVLNYDFKVFTKKTELKDIIPQAARKFVYNARLIMISLRDLIGGKYGLNNLQGPVGIVTVITESTEQIGFSKENFMEIINFMLDIAMLISVNLGIFNLLPLPALDGGRLVFLIIEAIRRKPLKPESEGMVHFIGFALLMMLMIAVTFNDIKNIFV